ncbi:transposase [Moorena sp. SIO3I6]|uniref:RNA-guided endonuclease InsQ/TnpB family protein n=1 Tax=Moorena sp. SIO3I6 TaxID=2607831 RepID=UPI0025E19488|nr:transposase [Moorena sp. SIO3I6]
MLIQTFRLYPTESQKAKLFYARSLHQLLYNACLAHRRYEWKVNRKSVNYLEQQNILPAYKECWPEYKGLYSTSLQATVKRVDLAYNSFLKGLRKFPRFKSIRDYSGWTYPSTSGWKVDSNGKHGTLVLNDLKTQIRMRGKAKHWGKPTTLTVVYKPRLNQWFASITVKVDVPEPKYGSESDLSYESVVAYDLGTETAITTFDGSEFNEIKNQRFTRTLEPLLKAAGKDKRRKRAPNRKQRVKPSIRWKKANRRESQIKRKICNQRKDWQHKVTSDLVSRYDIGVTEKLNTKGMTRKAKKGSKRKKQKAGLNKSILDVGFGSLNKMLSYKIELKGGIVLQLPTKQLKPSQRCPKCGKVHKDWANLSNRYHVCDECGFRLSRDKTSTMVMYNAALGNQPGYGNDLDKRGFSSSTSKTSKHTGSMKQLGKMKRQKSRSSDGSAETPSLYRAG